MLIISKKYNKMQKIALHHPLANLATALILFFIIGSLTGFGNWFSHPEYNALYLFEIGAALLIGCCGVKILFQKYFKPIISPIHFLLIGYGIYVLIHGLWIRHNFNSYHIYILISCLLIICIPILINKDTVVKIFRSIVFVAFAQSIICLLQAVKIFPSLNTYFNVTGTFSNPNITAMFLAMASCAIPFTMHCAKPFTKKIIVFACISIATALLLLNCRTAWLGLAGAGMVQLYHHPLFSTFLKRNIKRTSTIVVTTMLCLLVIAIGLRMYQSKKASADGRKLIWKISAQMVRDEPMFGFGFGQFEKHYNLYQANYFKNGKGTFTEKRYADHVNMAYNEFLQQGVIGGLIGALFFSGIVVWALLIPYRRKKETLDNPDQKPFDGAYSGMVCFTIMGLFNFTQQAIPVMALFVIFLALLMKQQQHHDTEKRNKPLIYVIACFLLALCMGLLANTIYTAKNEMTLKSLVLHRSNDTKKWEALAVKLTNNKDFWINYGNMNFKAHNYAEALEKYQMAQKLCSEKSLLLKTAFCHQQLGNIEEAINHYQLLRNMQPNWLQPKYQLLKIYEQQSDTLKTIAQATEILAVVPKVKSTKSNRYQNYARSILNTHQPSSLPSHSNNQPFKLKRNSL